MWADSYGLGSPERVPFLVRILWTLQDSHLKAYNAHDPTEPQAPDREI